MQKFFALAILLTVLGSAVYTPRCEAGPIRKVIMAKKMQKKQEQKQEQSQSSGAGANAKPGATGATGTTSSSK